MKLLTLFSVIVLAPFGAWSWGELSPHDSTSLIEGNNSSTAFFVLSDSPTRRFQQVYDASDFGPNFSGDPSLAGVLLTRLYFRVDSFAPGPEGGFSGTVRNLEIRMSTTAKQPDSLSPIFSENIGPNETLVLGPADTVLSGLRISPNGPQEWSVLINFPTPFLYRPSDGNLLVDFRVSGGIPGEIARLDAWRRIGDSVGSVSGQLGDVSGTASTIGLATFWNGTIVPEPSSVILLLVGLSAFVLIKLKRT